MVFGEGARTVARRQRGRHSVTRAGEDSFWLQVMEQGHSSAGMPAPCLELQAELVLTEYKTSFPPFVSLFKKYGFQPR